MNPNFTPNFFNNGMNFNNANPLLNGMNNQNFHPYLMNNNNMMMDQNAMRVRNIVEPYEKKIKELEEIIRQKDFEISILKDKLFNFNQMQGNNMANFNNNMNMNMNNQMMKLGFQNNMDNEINVKFIDENNKETTIKINKKAKTGKLLEKYLIDSSRNIRDFKFILNDNLLIPGFTLENNKISDNSIIYVKKKELLCLIFELDNGFIVSLILDENTSVCMAIIYFLLEIGKEELIVDLINNKLSLIFIFQASKVNLKETKSIKEYFGHNFTKIIVRDDKAIIGG